MTAPALSPLDKIVRGILILVQRMIREKAHGRVVITIRDGAISLVEEQRTRLPNDLPEV